MLTTLLLVALATFQDKGPREPVAPGRRAVRSPVVTNLGLAVSRADFAVTADGRHLGFLVDEARHGGQDLNGDGDALDDVFHVLDLWTGSLSNEGLAGTYDTLSASDSRFAWVVYEPDQGGTDLNGDGDAVDSLHVALDPSTNTVISPLGSKLTFAENPWAAVIVPEFGDDFNGNGATNDRVLFAWNTTSGAFELIDPPSVLLTTVTNGPSMLFLAAEDGLDLNGDGDTLDWILHAYDAGTGALFVTGLAMLQLPWTRDGVEALPVFEGSQGQDLNGDGDMLDEVLYVFHRPTFDLQPVGLALGSDSVPVGHANAQGTVVSIEGERVAFSVPEIDQGQDLNGSGALDGSILHVYDVVSRTTTNLAFAVWQHVVETGHVVFEVRELTQGQDLNGDGDQEDYVLHDHSLETGQTVNLGLTTQSDRLLRFQAAGGTVAFLVDEAAQGAVLNGDGDQGDEILHVYDLATGALTNTMLGAERRFLLGDRALYFTVNEANPPSADLNGDGDEDDSVLFAVDTRTHAVNPVGLAVAEIVLVVGRRGFVLVSEVEAGVDLNGDGDALDPYVLHMVRLRP